MGAFGLNASIMDAANLAWKIGLCSRNLAKISALGPTYDAERRLHAHCIIRVSGSYLRFVCNSEFPLAEFERDDSGLGKLPDAVPYTPGEDLEFVRAFFAANGQFLLGVDAAYLPSVLSPAQHGGAIAPRNGVRAPNPRVCFSSTSTGYLYDALTGAATIHLVVFASDLQGPVRTALEAFSVKLASSTSFYNRFGGRDRFNIVVVTKCLPYEAELLLGSDDLKAVRENARVLYDDRTPDEDAHSCYEVNHTKGAIVVVRPDLWVGTSVFLKDAEALGDYFEQWLVPTCEEATLSNGHV